MNNLTKKEQSQSILKQSLINGFKILLIMGLIVLSLFFIIYFKSNIQYFFHNFFVNTFKNIVQIHPYIFILIGYLLCGVFAFFRSFLLKTKDKKIINQKTNNFIKTILAFCFNYNILITSLNFIYIIYSVNPKHSSISISNLSYFLIFIFVLCLFNVFLLTFTLNPLKNYQQNKHSNDALIIQDLNLKGIIGLIFSVLFFMLIGYSIITIIPLQIFLNHFANAILTGFSLSISISLFLLPNTILGSYRY